MAFLWNDGAQAAAIFPAFQNREDSHGLTSSVFQEQALAGSALNYLQSLLGPGAKVAAVLLVMAGVTAWRGHPGDISIVLAGIVPPFGKRQPKRSWRTHLSLQTVFTESHIKVLRLIAEEKTNLEIAEALNLSLQTVMKHIVKIRLRMKNRLDIWLPPETWRTALVTYAPYLIDPKWYTAADSNDESPDSTEPQGGAHPGPGVLGILALLTAGLGAHAYFFNKPRPNNIPTLSAA